MLGEPPLMPARSRLYHLAPIGIGAVDSESLTGYISRLAQAHSVPVGVLIAQEIGPRCANASLAQAMKGHYWANLSVAMNGMETTALATVRVLEELTGRHDLHLLTLLPWVHVTSTLGLLRNTRAWCPSCYQGWRDTGQTIHEPLLWSLQVATVCPHHGQALALQCPECGKPHWPLTPAIRPGWCARCGHWLGVWAEQGRSSDAPEHLQLAEAAGAMIAATPTVWMAPGSGQLAQAIDAYIAGVDGERAAVVRTTEIPAGSLTRWRRGRSLPTLQLLLRFCAAQGLTIPALLAVPRRADAPRARISQGPGPRKQTPSCRMEVTARRRLAVEVFLEQRQGPPPSLSEVAHHVGCWGTDLYRACPDLCAAIVGRHRAYRHAQRLAREEQVRASVRRAVLEVHRQGRYPSTRRVAALLSVPGYLRARFAAKARIDTLQELGIRP